MIYTVPGTVPGTSVGTYRLRRPYSEALRALGGAAENTGAGKRRFSLTELKTPTPSSLCSSLALGNCAFNGTKGNLK